MATQPPYVLDWATTLTNNGPTGGPNKIVDTPTSYKQVGFVWDKKVPFELLNGWRNNVGQWVDYLETFCTELQAEDANLQSQIDGIQLDNLTGTTNRSWTIGESDDDITSKCIYVGSLSDGDNSGFLCWRLSPEFQNINPNNGNLEVPWMWWARDNVWSDEYPLRALTPDDLEVLQENFDDGVITEAKFNQLKAYVIYSAGDISNIALTEITKFNEAGVENFTVDVRYLGNTNSSAAKASAITQVSGQQEADTLTVIWYEARNVGQGNWTKVVSDTKVDNYTYTNGAWV